MSRFFRLFSGVRQGGILSPVFFCIYVDSVIDQITDLDIGCYSHGLFSGIWLYADDIILLSASVTGLQHMIDACCLELEKLDLTVNIQKTKCMRIGRRYKVTDTPIVINGSSVIWCTQLSYLGMVFTTSAIFKCNLHENKANFFRAANSILSRVGSKNIPVLMSLVFSKCVSMLSYGVTAMMLKKYECDKLDNCLVLFLAKIFGTFNKSILQQCLYYTGYLPVSLFVALNKMKFLSTFAQLENYNNTLFYSLKSVAKEELIAMSETYSINLNVSHSCRKEKMWRYFEGTL